MCTMIFLSWLAKSHDIHGEIPHVSLDSGDIPLVIPPLVKFIWGYILNQQGIWLDMDGYGVLNPPYPSLSIHIPCCFMTSLTSARHAKHPWLRRPFAAITQPGKLVGACRTAVRCCLAMDGFRGTVDQLGHLLTEKIKKDQPWSRLASTCHVKDFSLKCWFVNISNIIYM